MIQTKDKQEDEKFSNLNYRSRESTCQIDSNQVCIQNSDVEGDLKVIKIEAYQLSKFKVFISIAITLLSCLTFGILLKNSIKVRLRCIFNKSSVNKATHFLITNQDGYQQIVNRIKTKDKNKILFINRHMKYQYFDDFNKKSFYPVYYHQLEKQSLRDIKSIHAEGLNDHKVEAHLEKYGNCEIHIPLPSLIEYLFDNLTSVFFIFQYISMILWTLEGYLQFAILMISVSVFITLINYYLLKASLNKLKKFAKIDLNVQVIRNGVQQTIDCIDLLPGDLFLFQNNMLMPCDSLLLSGDALVNESSLTGESIPIPKISILQNQQQDDLFNMETMKNHILYEGTKVIQIKGNQVYGIVLRTGYTSFRGQIFRSMLYPKHISFKFYTNATYFLLLMIVMGVTTYFVELYFIIKIELPTLLIVYRFFDTVTWMIPAPLPIFFSICQTISLIRLGIKKVLATDPAKIVVAGDVSIMCFDKTGTLTKDQMELYGYCDYTCKKIKESLIVESKQEELLHKFFGSCHGVYLVNGVNLGDELDIRMLEFSQFEILPDESTEFKFRVQRKIDNCILNICKVWEFESSLQRMTVIMHDEQAQKFYGIVKGSPEKMFEMCNKDSVDEKNYNKILNELTNKGLRVIAVGYKEIQSKDALREEVEKDIQFAGLFVLKNKLKVDTADVIQQLQNGNILCKIISGDNLLTTVQCAKEARILSNESSNVLIFNSMSDCYVQNSQEKIDPLNILSSQECKKYQIGLTGKFLEEIQTHLQNGKSIIEQQILKNLLIQTSVFSRCKPKQKAEIIYMLQSVLNEKIGMIGDGANDCSAIKQSDMGISFTKTDASYSSPFSYSETSLDCVIKILAEGRCTLSNMIECYKFNLALNWVKFMSASILILELSFLSDIQVIFTNYFEYIPLLAFISLSKPIQILAPYRTISNMMAQLDQLLSTYANF
ncbi:E1-E2 ATPase family protein (macronuclear) [Tetrahymena thermophila SB210]|uniref:E1-E2 ATPase family protein n=1 Tax=Tetrahymena thermophila (strain SB210) TaxID=312017 RepID=Q22V52_TETTS|nr:E1-E2 ATPase family protein [Tetrahymena thermophila SB210]EAR89096.2 E1-E2 ATPase family protein [Tetrahymena thermophila SB210]|eukprot:XP_001009341.2 E1-E2 ATPase family protein [Tetrahymena thermophila SB210]